MILRSSEFNRLFRLPDPSGWLPPEGSPARRWLLFLLRLPLVGVAAWAASRVPLPFLEEWLPVRNLLIAGSTVLLTGKLLFDTLFYDRYWP